MASSSYSGLPCLGPASGSTGAKMIEHLARPPWIFDFYDPVSLTHSPNHLKDTNHNPFMSARPKSARIPKPTVLRDFFATLDEQSKNLLLLALNLEASTELSNKERQEKLEAELIRRAK